MQGLAEENGNAEVNCGLPRRPEVLNRRFLRATGISALFLAVLTYCLGVLPGQIRDSKVDKWPKVEASIIESSILSEKKSEPWGNGLRDYELYTPLVKYEYTYGSEVYQSELLATPKPTYRNEAEAAALSDNFVAGSTHDAWVNPNDPTQAVLIKVNNTTRNVIFLGALMLGMLGVFGLVMARAIT